MNPGLHLHLDIDEYHADPAISNTKLKDALRSMKRYYQLHLDPHRPEPGNSSTPSHEQGQRLHCAVLEPAEFDKRYIIGPDLNKNTNAWKAFVAESEAAGLKVIDQKAHDLAMGQAASVRAHPQLAALLSKGKPEVSAFAIDPDTGQAIRCRPDWTHDTSDETCVLVDVKGYDNVEPEAFARQIARMNYHIQAAHYCETYKLASGKRVTGFVFAAVEATYPFTCEAIMLGDMTMAQGIDERRKALNAIAAAKKANQYPGHDEIHVVDLPPYAFKDIT